MSNFRLAINHLTWAIDRLVEDRPLLDRLERAGGHLASIDRKSLPQEFRPRLDDICSRISESPVAAPSDIALQIILLYTDARLMEEQIPLVA